MRAHVILMCLSLEVSWYFSFIGFPIVLYFFHLGDNMLFVLLWSYLCRSPKALCFMSPSFLWIWELFHHDFIEQIFCVFSLCLSFFYENRIYSEFLSFVRISEFLDVIPFMYYFFFFDA